MKADSTRTNVLALVIATAAAAAFVWTGCSDDKSSTPTPAEEGHTSPYPTCKEIIETCHEVDVGEGAIHDCHETAHGAKSDSDCTPVKANCLSICNAAKADAGITEDGGEDHDGH